MRLDGQSLQNFLQNPGRNFASSAGGSDLLHQGLVTFVGHIFSWYVVKTSLPWTAPSVYQLYPISRTTLVLGCEKLSYHLVPRTISVDRPTDYVPSKRAHTQVRPYTFFVPFREQPVFGVSPRFRRVCALFSPAVLSRPHADPGAGGVSASASGGCAR